MDQVENIILAGIIKINKVRMLISMEMVWQTRFAHMIGGNCRSKLEMAFTILNLKKSKDVIIEEIKISDFPFGPISMEMALQT